MFFCLLGPLFWTQDFPVISANVPGVWGGLRLEISYGRDESVLAVLRRGSRSHATVLVTSNRISTRTPIRFVQLGSDLLAYFITYCATTPFTCFLLIDPRSKQIRPNGEYQAVVIDKLAVSGSFQEFPRYESKELSVLRHSEWWVERTWVWSLEAHRFLNVRTSQTQVVPESHLRFIREN